MRDEDRRIGWFAVRREMIIGDHPGWRRLGFLFCELVILEARLCAATDSFHYCALSEHFSLVPQGQDAPWYVFHIHHSGLGTPSILGADRCDPPASANDPPPVSLRIRRIITEP